MSWSRSPRTTRIDKILFTHGGVAPEYTALSISAINDSLKTFLQEDIFYSLLQDSIPASVDSIRSELYEGKIIAVDLYEPATEMLLLVRTGKNKHNRFKVLSNGLITPIQ